MSDKPIERNQKMDNGDVSVENSSTTPLGISATFTGEWEDISDYSSITVIAESDEAGDIYFEFSIDKTQVDRSLQIPSDSNGDYGIHALIPVAQYFRVRLVNGGVAQTSLRLQTLYNVTGKIAQPTSRISQTMNVNSDVLNTRTVLNGLLPDGTYGNVPADGLGFQTNSLLANGATYDSGVLSLEGYTQVQTHVLSDVDGTITINFIRDLAGTDVLRTLVIPYTGGSGYQTFAAPAFTPHVRYRFTADEAGQADFYFDTKFLTKSVSPQVLGVDAFISPQMVSTLGRNVIVGKTSGGQYNNVAIEPVSNALEVAIPRSAFGEMETVTPTPIIQGDFIYNVNADMFDTTTTGSGTVTQADAMGVVSTTATSSSSAKISTQRYIKYRPGQGVHIRGTALFTTGVANSEQLFGCGDDDNGFFFGYNGASFGIMSRNGGVDTWVAQENWNGDTLLGTGPTGVTLDHTKGNVYEIQFQWLGYGAIIFAVEEPSTGNFVPVHTIDYANNNTVPSVLNPSFPILWSVENTTNSTNIVLKGASCCAEVEGDIKYLGPTNAIGNTKTGITTTPTNILTIRNKSTYQSVTNKAPINVLKYSIAVDGNKPAEFQLIKNTTLGGTPSYTDVSTNTSVIEYDTAGTTITGGQVVDFSTLAASGSLNESGTETTEIILLPGETLTLAVSATTSTTDVTSAIRWVEDF